MKLLSSLDPKDRRMLLIVLGLVVALLAVLAIFTPSQNPDESQTPDSYLSGKYGAKAAYTLLEQSGYEIEHWEQPLSELAAKADATTVLIVAEPYTWDKTDRLAVASILRKGGRVLATGYDGGLLLPRNAVTVSKQATFAACEATPDGLQPLASGGTIWIVPQATWYESDSATQTAYTCAGQPVVVEYPVGKGHAIWWASSTPLENGSITRSQNLELLLNSAGPAAGQHIYWDESLHGKSHTQWDFVSGPVWPLLVWGSIGLALLVTFSYSRRSGPIRPLPQVPRTTPIEFLDALGSLYRSTGAAATATQIAWERFRAQAVLLTGQRSPQIDARQLAAAIDRRFGAVAKQMEPDMIAAEEACWDENLKPRRALALVQALRRHEETLRKASSHGTERTPTTLPPSAGVTLGS
jgi:hypothetical protein